MSFLDKADVPENVTRLIINLDPQSFSPDFKEKLMTCKHLESLTIINRLNHSFAKLDILIDFILQQSQLTYLKLNGYYIDARYLNRMARGLTELNHLCLDACSYQRQEDEEDEVDIHLFPPTVKILEINESLRILPLVFSRIRGRLLSFEFSFNRLTDFSYIPGIVEFIQSGVKIEHIELDILAVTMPQGKALFRAMRDCEAVTFTGDLGPMIRFTNFDHVTEIAPFIGSIGTLRAFVITAVSNKTKEEIVNCYRCFACLTGNRLQTMELLHLNPDDDDTEYIQAEVDRILALPYGILAILSADIPRLGSGAPVRNLPPEMLKLVAFTLGMNPNPYLKPV